MSYQFTISDIGLRLIKAYEGFWPEARALASGGQVVGFGHRVKDGEDEALSEEEAEDVLKADLAPIEDLINSRVHASMTQSQFDALCSLIFSIGEEAFLGSDMLHDLNKGQVIEASAGFDMWRKGNIGGKVYVVDALVRRRTAEKALFLRPTQRIARAPRFELASIREHALVEPMSETAGREAEPAEPEVQVDLSAAHEPEASILPEIGNIDDTTPEDDVTPEIAVEVETDTQADTTLQTLAVPVDPIIYSDDVTEEDPLTVENVTPLTIVEDIEIPEVDAPESIVTTLQDDKAAPVLTVVENDPVLETPKKTDKPEKEASPIAAAAAEVSDRLDALIENDPVETSKTDTNLTTASLLPENKVTNEVIIDELQKDDALREQIARESQYNTNRYDDYVEVEDESGSRGIMAFGIMILVGLAAAISGLVINMKGSLNILGENGPFITIAAMLIGGLLVIVGLLYLLKAIFTRE